MPANLLNGIVVDNCKDCTLQRMKGIAMGILIQDVLAVLPEGARTVSIFIKGNRIENIGDFRTEASYDEIIDGRGRLAVPGLVNAHAHTYMTALRNYADDLPFDTWLFDRVMPAEESLTPEEAYWSSSLACLEMLRGGITSFLDMHMFPGAACRAAIETGMRAVVSRGLSGGADDIEGGKRRLREAVAEFHEYRDNERLTFMLAPHALYTCDEGYLREIADKARELGLGINTHIAEGKSEIRGSLEKYGLTPFQVYDRCGLLGESTIAAHCVHMTDADIELMRERGASVALNPFSNLKLANGVARVPDMLRAGINLCLGTDSSASNNSLSILRELQITATLHKGLTGNPEAVTASESFKMATVNGARALGLRDVGELRGGMMADIAIFDVSTPGMTPLGDPLSALAYSSAGLQAETVIVDGEIALRCGEYKKADTERILYETNAIGKRLNRG